MYEAFSADYDRFVDWPARLAAEMPFIERQLASVGAQRVLDAACGTGMHAIALAQRGYQVTGTDLSAGMVERARANAASAGIGARFEAVGFGELAHRVETSFDALLCLGNSLPHLLTPADLAMALADFAACLQPGGLLLIQNRNFDAVVARRERWMSPQSYYEEENAEWLFFRFYDFVPDGTLVFNVVTPRRVGGSSWDQQVAATRLWPQQRAELERAVRGAGFEQVTCWGDMTGVPFDPAGSPNLIISAVRSGIRSAQVK